MIISQRENKIHKKSALWLARDRVVIGYNLILINKVGPPRIFSGPNPLIKLGQILLNSHLLVIVEKSGRQQSVKSGFTLLLIQKVNYMFLFVKRIYLSQMFGLIRQTKPLFSVSKTFR